MTSERAGTPSDVVGARVREVRDKRRLTREQLAERCADEGATALTAAVISDIETGRKTGGKRRRTVSVDEWLALALALNVAPVHLLVPVDEPGEAYQVTPLTSSSRFSVRAWIRGVGSIDHDADQREFHSEVPPDEFYLPAHKNGDGTRAGAVQQGPSHGGYTGVVRQPELPADEG